MVISRDIVIAAFDALGVVATDMHIRRYLSESDPKALAQAQAAIDALARALGEPI